MFTDLKYKIIYNYITFPAIILGLSLNLLYSGLSGLKSAMLGLLVGGFILLIFYLSGGVGAGDIKFLAAIGSLKGASFVFYSTLYGAILGGFFAIFYLLYKNLLISTFLNIINIIRNIFVNEKEKVNLSKIKTVYLPYGFFLGLGAILFYIKGNLLN